MEKLREELKKTIKELFNVEVTPVVTPAPAETGADFATNVAMQLTGRLQQNPREIAQKIIDNGEFAGFNAEIAGPGFINFISPDDYFVGKIEKFADEVGENISCDEYNGEKVICEFSDPNPFKVLHVGHLYTSIVGEAISRLFEAAGARVVRANFGGDVGLHVAKTLWALDTHRTDPNTLADAYVRGTRAYEEDEHAKAEIVELNKKIYEIAQKNVHEGELAELYWQGREASYAYFEDFYNKIGVKFDKYYPESTVAGRGLAEVKNGLDKGVYELSDGAVVYKGEKVGLHTRVFINKEGLPTYETKDVGLIFTKWDDYKFDKSVVITGNDIIDYMKVVLASVAEMAPELPKRTVHLTHGQVKLPGNQKMSSRKGNFLKAVDVLAMVRDELGGEKADEKVVLAATKYAFLKYKVGGDIIFDPKESVKLTGNSGVYLLYSAVRAKKILSKAENNADETGAEKLNNFEKNLCKKIAQYEEILKEAVTEMAPYKICNFLYEMSQEFSRFYEKCPVVGGENEAMRKKIVRAYLNVMEHGLGLIGIEIPEEM